MANLLWGEPEFIQRGVLAKFFPVSDTCNGKNDLMHVKPNLIISPIVIAKGLCFPVQYVLFITLESWKYLLLEIVEIIEFTDFFVGNY